MRLTPKNLLLVIWLICACAQAQTGLESSVQTTVCELVSHPLQFKGKLIRVRAQIWSDNNKFWLNESAAGSMEIGKVCRWLPAEFTHSTKLIGSSAFGTFTGRLVFLKSGRVTGWPTFPAKRPGLAVKFVVEHESDIYNQKIQNGLVLTPQLYDARSNTFVRPE